MRSAQRRLDGAQAEYLRRFYGLDIDDASLYHLILDATAFSVSTVVDLLAVRALSGVRVIDQRPG